MLKADTQLLEQNINQNVLNIRNLELGYYNSFYITIGAQSALIGGFAYNAMTQITFNNYIFGNPIINTDDTFVQYSTNTGQGLKPLSTNPKVIVVWIQIFQSFFYISTAICLAAAIYCIFVSLILQVFGSGLALLGPIGSMAKATKGLKSEMFKTFVVYNIMLISFGISSFFSFWLVMDIVAAVISSVVTVIVYVVSIVYSIRIYRNFGYDIRAPEIYLNAFDDDYDPDDEDDTNNGVLMTKNRKASRTGSLLDSMKNAISTLFNKEGLNETASSSSTLSPIVENDDEKINNLANSFFIIHGTLKKELRSTDKAVIDKVQDYSQIAYVGLWKGLDTKECPSSLLTYTYDKNDIKIEDINKINISRKILHAKNKFVIDLQEKIAKNKVKFLLLSLLL